MPIFIFLCSLFVKESWQALGDSLPFENTIPITPREGTPRNKQYSVNGGLEILFLTWEQCMVSKAPIPLPRLVFITELLDMELCGFSPVPFWNLFSVFQIS